MKKTRCLWLFCLTAALIMLFAFSASAGLFYTIGDVDENGVLEAADARLVLRAAVGLESFGEDSYGFLAADADYDGSITASDARLVLRAAVGLEELVHFGSLLEDSPEYRIGIDHWTWYEDGNNFVDVFTIVQNRTKQTMFVCLDDWNCNHCMINSAWNWYEDSYDIFLGPGEVKECVFRLYDDDTPVGFSLAPTGELEFYYYVRLYDEALDQWDYIGSGRHGIYDSSLLEYAYYEPPYPDSMFYTDPGLCRFRPEEQYIESDYESNWLSNYFFYQNISDDDQYVGIRINAVNGISTVDAEGYVPTLYRDVFSNSSILMPVNLVYDWTDYSAEWILNRLGLLPSQVYSLDITLLVYDFDFENLLGTQDFHINVNPTYLF